MKKIVSSDASVVLRTSVPDTLPGLSLRVNFAWTLMGSLVYAASQWGMLTVLSKIGTPKMVGLFALGLAVTAPIITLSKLTLQIVQATDAKQEFVFGDYLGLRLATTTIALMTTVAIVIWSDYRLEVAMVILIIGLAKAIEAISDVIFGLLQRHERMDRIALSKMIKGPLSLIFFGVTVYLSKSILWGSVALAITWALVLVGYDLQSAKGINREIVRSANKKLLDNRNNEAWSLRPRWKINTQVKLVWLALPLGLASMLNSLKVNIPRYFIELELGLHELGVFAAIAYLIVAGTMVSDSLGRAATPRLAKYYTVGNKGAYRSLLSKLLGVATVMGSLGILTASIAGEQMLTLLYQAEYARQSLFVQLMIVAAISYITSCLGFAVTAARFFKVQLVIFIIVVSGTTIASIWLIPTHGLSGAAMSLVAGFVVQAIGYLAVIVHALRSIDGATTLSNTFHPLRGSHE